MIDLQSAFEKAWNNFITQELPILWEPVKPYVIGALTAFFLYGFIKFFGKRIVKLFSQVGGDTKRETRRKESRFCDIVDLFSSLKDVFSAISKR